MESARGPLCLSAQRASPCVFICLCESISGTAAVPLAFAPPPTTGLRLAHVETPADKCFWAEKKPGNALTWLGLSGSPPQRNLDT